MKMTCKIFFFVYLLSQDFTSSMSQMTIGSTGDKVNSKSSSYDSTTFDDYEYSEYDFDDEEDATCNVKFNFRLFRGDLPLTLRKKYAIFLH